MATFSDTPDFGKRVRDWVGILLQVEYRKDTKTELWITE